MKKVTLQELRHRVHTHLRNGTAAAASWVVAPYRINPLGAHVDHQGGAVLGRTIDQYTVMAFAPRKNETAVKLETFNPEWKSAATQFPIGRFGDDGRWVRYAQGAAAALHQFQPLAHGLHGVVAGSLIGAGLSSSASVLLTYLLGLAAANDIYLSKAEQVELVRQVENGFMGLNNGVQDQTAISYGRRDAIALMDTERRVVSDVPNPPQVDEVCWILAYSGFSRELLGSGFNDRVAECRRAAALLDPQAKKLGDVAVSRRGETALRRLPQPWQKRARHYYSETERVARGAEAWAAGEWERFGAYMNASCDSSITQYESGSRPLVDLQEIAAAEPGVYGSRFSGGGYGGCLILLAERAKAQSIMDNVREKYLRLYPEKAAVATAFIAEAEDGARLELLGEEHA